MGFRKNNNTINMSFQNEYESQREEVYKGYKVEAIFVDL